MTETLEPVLGGEIALVTGGSRGIGRAIARELAARGATVVATATSESGAVAIRDHFADTGLPVTAQIMDVRLESSVNAVQQSVAEDLGAVSILVNNAGVTGDGLLLSMKEQQWQAVIDVNLSGMYRVSRAFLRGMVKARRGRVINISSVVGAAGNAGQSNYAAAKAGMIGFTRALAQEVASRSITVNAVAPGFVETDMTRQLDEKQHLSMLEKIPLGRFGQVDEVAGLVAYLASPAAGYITGQTIHINGGMYMG